MSQTPTRSSSTKSKPTTSKKTRAPRKAKSAVDLKAQLEKAKATVASLEKRAYAGELEEAVKKAGIVAAFAAIKNSVKGANDLAILAAIGKAVGIARVEVTQKPPVTRKAKAK